MLANYSYIGLFLIVAFLFVVATLLFPVILRILKIIPQKPSPIKSSTFECGMKTIGKSWIQFNFRYYFYALMFITFDTLVVFVYPWAVGLRQLGYFGLIMILIFISIIIVGYIYAWRKKVLEWK